MATSTEFDFDGRYSVSEYGGIAWYAIGYATEWTEEEWIFDGTDEDDTEDESLYVCDEPEEIEDREHVRAVMVGDDRVFTFEIDELTLIDEDAYCHECGQIGCQGDFRNA